jgi:hypothetical protein
MDVRIPGAGDNLVRGACRPMLHFLNPYAHAAERPCGAILAGVFGSNDVRAEHLCLGRRFSVVTGLMPRGEPTS